MADAGPATAAVALEDAAGPARLRARDPARHGTDVGKFYGTWVLGAVFPGLAGLLLFGWRPLALLAVMLPVALGTAAVWRRIGTHGRQVHLGHLCWLTVLLWLILPPHLLSRSPTAAGYDLWPVAVAAPMLLAVAAWVLGGAGSGRIHPVIVTYLLLVTLFDPLMAPGAVLGRQRLFAGDVTRAAAPPGPMHAYLKDGYRSAPPPPAGYDAYRLEPPHARLLSFTSGRKRPGGRSWLSLESLLRDEMPPLEDLIIGAHPGGTGATCAVAVIIGGLFLLYRGVVDFRVPLCVVTGAYLALLALPIPVVIKDTGPEWRWLAFGEGAVTEVGLAKAVTFANYQMMAGPMLLATFFLATAPVLRPLTRRARVIYGLLVGVAAAGMQLYVSVSWGPYVAVLAVSLLSPLLDRAFRQHPLV